MSDKTMQTFKTHSKYFIIAALTFSIVGGVFAQVSIPTGLTNAVQYIMETVWTDDGTDTGLVNVQIDDTNIYVRTGFLADGTGWNSKALGVDSSGNVVYVNANAINTPFFNLAGNYIPKINQAGNDLELSTMFQGTLGDISVGHINPLAKMHIQGDFRVDTISGSLMQYTYSTGGAQVIGAVTAPDPSQLCNCDTTTNALNCTAPSFTTGLVQGAGQFCVDITFSGGGTRNYRVYMQNTTNINQGAFIVTGNRAGVMTLTPQATLDVNGNVMIQTTPSGPTTRDVLTINPTTREVSTRSAGSFLGGTATGYSLNNVGGGSPLITTLSSPGNIIWSAKSLVAGQGITLTSTLTEITVSAVSVSPQTLSLIGNTLSISSGNSVSLPAATAANAWNLTGNTGTNPSTNFIGTIDNNNLVFKTNNTIIGGLQTNGAVQRGLGNSVASNNSTIAGGTTNQIQLSSNSSTIGGGQQNTISLAGGDSATIAGGKQNIISASYATIAGGWNNTGSGISSFIGGGYQNKASGQNSSIVGGQGNIASGLYATIGGGDINIASSQRSTVGGGGGNTSSSIGSTVGGGYSNSATGAYSTVPGGSQNSARGANSFAAGTNAIASGSNSFVWSDGTQTYPTAAIRQNGSNFNNEFMVNADKVIIGDIENANILYRRIGYWNGGFDTYLPGNVLIDEITTANISSTNATFTNQISVNNIMISDQRLKTDIIEGSLRSTNALNIINNLNPITYKRGNNIYTQNLDINKAETHYGFIAQEVNTLYPELTNTINPDALGYTGEVEGGDFIGVKYTEIIPILVQAIKEQQAIIQDLEFRLSNLEGGPIQ